jgi:hypothetical protein
MKKSPAAKAMHTMITVPSALTIVLVRHERGVATKENDVNLS